MREKPDIRQRDQALSTMQDQEYNKALLKLLKPIAPAHFVTPAHLDTLLAQLSPSALTDQQFVDLVEAILRIKRGSELNRLSPRVKTLNKKPLEKLRNLLEEIEGNESRAFKQAVDSRKKEVDSFSLKNSISRLLKPKR